MPTNVERDRKRKASLREMVEARVERQAKARYDKAAEEVDEDKGLFGIGLSRTQELELLTTLAELGGGTYQDDDIHHQGKTLVLPEGMTNWEAIEFLHEHDQRQNEETKFEHEFRYRPWDGAVALHRSLKKLFGTSGLNKPIWTFFGKEPPELHSVSIGVDEKIQVPWGRIDFPLLEAQIYTSVVNNRVYGPLFQVVVNAPRKHEAEVAGLFRAIELELQESSIYRGKAFDGQDEPEFIDLKAINPDEAIYSAEVEAQLEANIWSLISYTELQRNLKVPLKRAVLLEGPYGCGKTLAAFVTATKAATGEIPWTFIYCRPGQDSFASVMATARLYQPAIVFAEDVDTIASTGEDDPLSRLLDLFDGIKAKGTEIMVILTTNHIDRLHKAMARPGRLDSIIRIGPQDADAIQRMIQVNLPSDLLDPEMDYAAIGEAMDGFMPAFVKEAIDRATRYGIVRAGGQPDMLRTQDFVLAGHGLRPQLELQQKLGEGEKPKELDVALGNVVRETTREAVHGSRLLDLGENEFGHVHATNGGSTD